MNLYIVPSNIRFRLLLFCEVLHHRLFSSWHRRSNRLDLLVRPCKELKRACQSACHIFFNLSTICLTTVIFCLQQKLCSLVDLCPRWVSLYILRFMLYVIHCIIWMYTYVMLLPHSSIYLVFFPCWQVINAAFQYQAMWFPVLDQPWGTTRHQSVSGALPSVSTVCHLVHFHQLILVYYGYVDSLRRLEIIPSCVLHKLWYPLPLQYLSL